MFRRRVFRHACQLLGVLTISLDDLVIRGACLPCRWEEEVGMLNGAARIAAGLGLDGGVPAYIAVIVLLMIAFLIVGGG